MRAGCVGYLVLDEADKMLSLGLQPQLEAIRAAVLQQEPAKNGTKKKASARPRPQVRPWCPMLQLLRSSLVRRPGCVPCPCCKKICCDSNRQPVLTLRGC